MVHFRLTGPKDQMWLAFGKVSGTPENGCGLTDLLLILILIRLISLVEKGNSERRKALFGSQEMPWLKELKVQGSINSHSEVEA